MHGGHRPRGKASGTRPRRCGGRSERGKVNSNGRGLCHEVCLVSPLPRSSPPLPAPARAVTITNDRLAGEAYELDPTQFASLSTFFEPHGSVTTSLGVRADGRHAILKNLADAIPDGRYNPDGEDIPWIDSADIGLLRWDVTFTKPARAFGFGVVDDADTPTRFSPVPFWRLAVGGATVDAVPRLNDSGEPVRWYTILFDQPTRSASLTMRTAVGDGYGVVGPTVAAVPLPAAGLLLLGAVGVLAAVRRPRRAAEG